MSGPAPVRVLVADDDDQVRFALCGFIESEPGLELAGSAADAQEAIDLAMEVRPDVAMLDVDMPAGGGPRAAREIRNRLPGCRVVALSAADDRGTVLAMVEAGASGYLVKGGPINEIGEALRSAAMGESSLSRRVAGGVVDELASGLRERRREERRLEARRARIQSFIDEPTLVRAVLQPICDLQSGAAVGHEALARFDSRPVRPPDHWFRAAETVGIGVDLELSALDRALGRLADVPDDAFLSVNGSPATFVHAQTRLLLADLRVDRIVLEITEHAPVHDYEVLSAGLAPLRERGARVAVDDAGAGFASLRHILRLGPDLIKLDRSLVAGIHSDDAQQALAAGLIGFARQIGARIVAEGIETAAELTTLRGLGVDYGQGYLFAPPAPEPVHTAGSHGWGAA